MRILMTGATGLIGRELGKALAARGDALVCLVRDTRAARRRLPFPAECHAWDHTRPVPAAALREVDAVVNLAGEPVADTRWTESKKALIRDSRVHGTRQLVRALLEHGAAVAAFVQGSASASSSASQACTTSARKPVPLLLAAVSRSSPRSP